MSESSQVINEKDLFADIKKTFDSIKMKNESSFELSRKIMKFLFPVLLLIAIIVIFDGFYNFTGIMQARFSPLIPAVLGISIGGCIGNYLGARASLRRINGSSAVIDSIVEKQNSSNSDQSIS